MLWDAATRDSQMAELDRGNMTYSENPLMLAQGDSECDQ
jgi:hypothetical protein